MKSLKHILLTLATVCVFLRASAAIVVPGADGSDSELNITTNTVIDLSQAITGQWDTNNAAHSGSGVYDPEKWAVVFKYTNVRVAAGATVTFNNHPSRAPVVWLVSGDVFIDGTVSLDGQDSQPAPRLAEPGPGGFRGASGAFGPGVSSASGFGFGGSYATRGYGGGEYASSASYGGVGSSGYTPILPLIPTYGNPSLIPLIGGSGGGGLSSGNVGGGAGGGAMLIASAGDVFVGEGGSLRATGGSTCKPYLSGSGSGGGIRISCSKIGVRGQITALGGACIPGGVGRIRIERVATVDTLNIVNAIEPAPSVIDSSEGSTALLWPPVGAPQVRIVSVGGSNTSIDPQAEFGTIGADVALPLGSPIQVIVETKNVETNAMVTVRGSPRNNGDFTLVPAAIDSIVNTDPLVVRWVATLPVNVGYSALQAKVVRP